jgi:ABC-2 type transport system ATP-binding protein
MSVAAVEICELVKEFRTSWRRRRPLRAVDRVSLRIEAGEVYGLIGPNGSGKSTTMKALLGLLVPSSGSCAIFGRDSLRVDSRREVGFLPENPYFYRHSSGAETVEFYGRLCGLRGAGLRRRVGELLELVGLSEAAERRLAGYSKGMLQRIGLAQALVQEPRLLILDEPTAGVDPLGSRQIRDLILALRGRGITVFLCSHLLEHVQEVCDRIGIIFRGRMIREGTLAELTTVEDQSEILLRGAGLEVVERLAVAAAAEPGVEVVRAGRARTTLEEVFLRETRDRGVEPPA